MGKRERVVRDKKLRYGSMLNYELFKLDWVRTCSSINPKGKNAGMLDEQIERIMELREGMMDDE